MKNTIKKYFPLITILLFTLLIFRKTWLFGFIPIPFNLMTATFFPYNHGGWRVDYRPSPVKGGWYAIDAVRQIYPWKQFSIEQLATLTFPLWNPHNFSGSPFLANLQSSLFYPFNLLFFLIPSFPFAWTVFLFTAVYLPAFFMYVFLRSLERSQFASLIGSLAFAGCGQMIDWLEWGVITHTFIWLPLILFSLNKLLVNRSKRYLLLLISSLVFLIFAGYAQRAAYGLLITLVWIIFSNPKKNQDFPKNKPIYLTLIAILLALGITAVQWLPTAELYFHSAMRGKVSIGLSERAALPWAQLITFIAPDFFGNRVTNNYWGKEVGGADYMDADMFLGVIPFMLFVVSFIKPKKSIQQKTLIALFILGLLLALSGPISTLVAKLNLPVVSTGAASEAGIISVFSGCALSAFGWDALASIKKSKQRNVILTALSFLFIYVGLYLTTFIFPEVQRSVAQKNLIIPFTTFCIAIFLIVMLNLKNKIIKIIKPVIIIIIITEFIFHADKMLPFSSAKLAYPQHILIDQVKKVQTYDRTAGFWETELIPNLETALGLYSSEGYDPLYSKRYGEFMASAQKGELVAEVPRADADLEQKNETNRNRVLDLTSTRYIIAKVTDPENTWEQEPLKYDPNRFNLIWQKNGFKLYENLFSLPRVKLYTDWKIIEKDKDIISSLYGEDFNPNETLILEENPSIKGTEPIDQEQYLMDAEITVYEPNRVEIDAKSEIPTVLLLTDSFYPGWQATVDGKPTNILRANYTFRAVPLNSGRHRITFSYQPDSFRYGLMISLFSMLVTVFFIHSQSYKKLIK
jgi:hypothetical protein